MPKALRPRGGQQPRGTPSRQASLPRDIVDEVRRSTRPQDQEPVLSRLARAIELLERGDSGAAAVEAEKAKKQANRSSAVREVLGLAYYGQGRWQDAVTELKAYRRLSGRPDQNHLIADSLRGLGRPQDAVPLADEALRDRKVPADVKAEAVIVAASALADQGRTAEALSFLRRAATKEDVSEPWTLRLWYVRGDILEKAGRREEAAAEFRRVVRHDASAFDAAERLASLS
ncbi:MAG TPA: tetratricopeptide repeat protein [Actinomycetota bacterium]|nr:tetratricopeptide repeat protein [Actinomycetota bacterium]